MLKWLCDDTVCSNIIILCSNIAYNGGDTTISNQSFATVRAFLLKQPAGGTKSEQRSEHGVGQSKERDKNMSIKMAATTTLPGSKSVAGK